MSETIQGSKSLLYSKEPIPGAPGSGDSMQHLSVQEVSGKRGAADVVIHGTTVVSTGKIIEAGSVKKKIVSTAHGAQRGWVMRPSSGNSLSEEIIIVDIINEDTFAIAYEADLTIGDTFDLCRFITPNYTSTGDLNVVVNSSGPIQYKLNGSNTEVSQDTVAPANSNPLPTNLFIQKNGQNLPVAKDTVTPSNTNPIPVEIVSGSGTTINITAGDIDIHSSSEGANFDSIRVGDGSGVYVGVTPSGEAKVFDANANTSLGQIATDVLSIDLKTPNLVAGKVPVDTGLTQPLTDAQLRATPVPVIGTVKEAAKTGSFDEKLGFTTVQTFVAPANAVSANIMNVGNDNVRYKQGAAASGSSGLRLEPGRSEMVMNGSNISVIPETGSGACDVAIVWNVQP